MFGRLNAKLAHLKATSQRAQTPEPSAGPSTLTGTESPASPVIASHSASNTPHASAVTSRAASPPVSSPSFQAVRAAKSLAINSQVHPLSASHPDPPCSLPASHPDSPALRSYHLYVETPLEHAVPPLASPTATAASVAAPSPPTKRRLSSPRAATPASIAPDVTAHPAKHTRLDAAFIAHHPSPISLPASAFSQQQPVNLTFNQQQPETIGSIYHQHQPETLGAIYHQQQPVTPGSIYHQQYASPMLQHTGQQQPQHACSQHQAPHVDSSAMHMLHGVPGTAAGSAALSSEPSEGRALEDFQLLHTLGTGTFGRVFLCQSKRTQRFYAMKVLRKSQVVKLKQVEHINNEKNILEVSRHPFIVQLECTMQNERNLYMLMEYVPGGELFSHLRRAGRFPDDVARFYAAEIVLALDYLHSMKIIWRDTKPENLLLDAAGHVKLTDFGFAKRVEERTWTLCGTPEYLAPEIIQSKGHGKAVDWWALGILIFEMLAGYPPFYDDNPFGIYEKILDGKLVFPGFFTPAAKDLIQRLLTADVSKRLGNLQGDGRDVKAHPWFSMIDWDVLVRRGVPAPIVPPHRHPGDTCNFDKYPEPPQEPAPEPGVDPYFHLFSTF
ncbi:cAMP-dependent protein kinase catalytic subunit [Coemansia sp. RSA 1972]|nr:cAMP-dependent protein kinase catalytic subunit [Coemansia sp. RSA 1972]